MKIFDYLALVTSEYQNSPKFLAWVKANVQIVLDIANVFNRMKFNFGIDSKGPNRIVGPPEDDKGNQLYDSYGQLIMAVSFAVGNQLDILGQIIGQKRKVDFQPTGGVSPILDDTTYRTLLLAKIGINYWDGKIPSLKALWKRIFPTGRITVVDNHNMTMIVYIWGGFSSIIEDLIVNGLVVPRPQGVLLNYVYGTLPYFGCDREDSYVAGPDVGHAV